MIAKGMDNVFEGELRTRRHKVAILEDDGAAIIVQSVPITSLLIGIEVNATLYRRVTH